MSKKKIITIVAALVIFLALAGGVVWLFMSGKLVWAGAGQQTASYEVVCDSEMVDVYNRAIIYEVRDESSEPSFDTDTLKDLSSTIRDNNSYAADPTCQAILFRVSIVEKDYDAAKAAYEEIKSLHDKRIFADSNIRTSAPVSDYEAVLDTISPSYGSREEGFGGGGL
jgi:hypothetical protein